MASLFSSEGQNFDSALTNLFTASAGPVRLQPSRSAPSPTKTPSQSRPSSASGSTSESGSTDPSSSDEEEEPEENNTTIPARVHRPAEDLPKSRSRKRKRDDEDDTIERKALARLTEADSPELQQSEHREGASESEASGSEPHKSGRPVSQALDDATTDEDPIPQHESLSKVNGNPDLEKASRTVFLGNVSTQAISSKSARKTLLKHLASFLPDITASDPPHKVESIRFRSTAFESKLPKKAAFITKDLMDSTTHSTNAYAVYSTKLACREAARRLNGTTVLDRHIRVDQVAHPAKVDHKRCVFVGNLDFVDDDSNIREDSGDPKANKSKKRQPADVEEGLWREFSKIGLVESVRVVRDQKTRVGKGFAYVQFTDGNAVEAALLLNDKKYPPLLPRKLRVMRAKAQRKNSSKGAALRDASFPDKTHAGRAGKLYGKAGAYQAKNDQSKSFKRQRSREEAPLASKVVFEGVRATRNDTTGLKLGGRRKVKSKPRRTKRSISWTSK